MNPARTLKTIETTRRSAINQLNGMIDLALPEADFGQAIRGLGEQGIAAITNNRIGTLEQVRNRIAILAKYEGLSVVLKDATTYAVTASDLFTLALTAHEQALADASCPCI